MWIYRGIVVSYTNQESSLPKSCIQLVDSNMWIYRGIVVSYTNQESSLLIFDHYNMLGSLN